MPKFQLVRIKWIDVEANTGWVSYQEGRDYQLFTFEGVGLLAEWNGEFILLAGIRDESHEQINSCVYYPVGCVLSVEEVKCK